MNRRNVIISVLPLLVAPALADDCKEVLDITKLDNPVNTTFDDLVHMGMSTAKIGDYRKLQFCVKKTAKGYYELDWFVVTL